MLAERRSSQDEYRRPGMKIIADIRFAELDIDLDDIRGLIELNKNRMQQGFEPEMTAFLTRSSRFGNIGDIFQALADGLPVKLRIFHNLRDTVKWLELSDAEEEISRFLEKAREGY